MTKIRLPYIHEFIDRHGKVRRYVRRPGRKRVPLPGAPGTAEFNRAYEAALADEEVERPQIGAARTVLGTINPPARAVTLREAFERLPKISRDAAERYKADIRDADFDDEVRDPWQH